MLTATEFELLGKLAEEIRNDLLTLFAGDLDDDNWRFFDEQFSGACAIVSWLLIERAREHGIELFLMGTRNHCWTETAYGTVVDPTFAQFATPGDDTETYIGEHRQLIHEFHGEKREPYCGRALKKELRMWPIEQSPFSELNEPILREYLGRNSLAA